jgi:hypothetical protein
MDNITIQKNIMPNNIMQNKYYTIILYINNIIPNK